VDGDFIHSIRYIIEEFMKKIMNDLDKHIFNFERDGDGHMAVPFIRHLPRAPGKFKCFGKCRINIYQGTFSTFTKHLVSLNALNRLNSSYRSESLPF
jgi:hypothetical protein